MSEVGRKYLYDKLVALINFACKEHDLDYGEVVQVLEMQKFRIQVDALAAEEIVDDIKEVNDGDGK